MFNWNLTTLPLAKIFWSILTIEIVGFGFMMILAAKEEAGSGLAIEHFAAGGGDLVYLVSLVCLVCVVRRTRETRQTRAPNRPPLTPPSPHTTLPHRLKENRESQWGQVLQSNISRCVAGLLPGRLVEFLHTKSPS